VFNTGTFSRALNGSIAVHSKGRHSKARGYTQGLLTIVPCHHDSCRHGSSNMQHELSTRNNMPCPPPSSLLSPYQSSSLTKSFVVPCCRYAVQSIPKLYEGYHIDSTFAKRIFYEVGGCVRRRGAPAAIDHLQPAVWQVSTAGTGLVNQTRSNV